MSIETQKIKDSTGPRVITIRLRLPVFITIVVLFLAGLAWIFFMGTLAGRGYNSREGSGPLAAIVPAPKPAEQSGAQDTTAPSGGNADTGGISALFTDDGLVPSEDLDFKDNLRGPADTASDGSINTPSERHAGAGATGSQGGGTAARTGTDGITATPGQAGTTGGAGAAVGTPAARPQTAQSASHGTPQNMAYEYIYQVSSFNQLHQAQTLTQKLNDGGIPAQIEQYKTSAATWYRVLVTFKGKESELSAFQQKLKKFNLNSPMLRKKKAVSA